MAQVETIEGSGYPLGFRIHKGMRRPSVLGLSEGRDIFLVEARQLAGHQKEAVVHEGSQGSAWRLTSDEGKHIKGKDVSPFPLGYFNAGLQADLMGRISALAAARAIPLSTLQIALKNGFWMTGSFFRGTGEGFAEPAQMAIDIASTSNASEITTLVADAVAGSPALAAMRAPLTNTFALYVNGRRRPITTMAASTAADAKDPFVAYQRPPEPLAADAALSDLVVKTGEVRSGSIEPAPAGTTTRIIRTIAGSSRMLTPLGTTQTETVLELPGMSHFALKSDERADADQAPCGISLVCAGIAFCYMTQLSRYIEHMKMDIHGIRLVQSAPFWLGSDHGAVKAGIEPVDTHLFLNGHASEETFEQLMHIAARTCYLHATLKAALEPEVTIVLNGTTLSPSGSRAI